MTGAMFEQESIFRNSTDWGVYPLVLSGDLAISTVAAISVD